MGFLATKADGTSIRVSPYTGGGSQGPQFVDSAGNVWDESRAAGGGLVDTGVDVSALLYDAAGDPAGGGAGAQVLSSVSLSAPGPSISISGLSLSTWLWVQVIATIRANAAGEGVGNWVRTMLRFNDDAGAGKYIWGTQFIDGTNIDNDDVGFVNGIEGLHGSGTVPGANYQGANIYDLLLPGSSTQYKSVTYQGGVPYLTNVLGGIGSGYWKSVAPITKLTILSNDSSDFAIGSRVDVIGMALNS